MSLSVCVSVCEHISSTAFQTSPSFIGMLPMAVACSFYSGVAICYVLPVFAEDVVFAHNGQE